MNRFTRQNVLITGASSGIGAAMVRIFVREGANVIAVARRLDKLKQLAEETNTETQGRILPLVCDVTQDGELERVVQQAHETFGLLDVVVANAGYGQNGTLEDLTLDEYRRQFETNVFGVLRTVYATLEDLKQTQGRLGLVGSVNSYAAFPQTSAYCMSKAAVKALGESLYGELFPFHISVTTIIPGFMESEGRAMRRQGTPLPGDNDLAPLWLVMPATTAAEKIVNALYKRKREQVITLHGRLMIWIRNVLPWLYGWLLRRLGRDSTNTHPQPPAQTKIEK